MTSNTHVTRTGSVLTSKARPGPSTLVQVGRGITVALLAAVLLGMAFGWTSAEAEEDTNEQEPQFLVGNLGVGLSGSGGIQRALYAARSGFAQAFTTGAQTEGYALGSLGIQVSHFHDASIVGDHLQVTINGVASDGQPGDAHCTLTNPSSFSTPGVIAFEAPTGAGSCQQLETETTYFVVIEWANPSETGSFALIPQTYPTEESAATEEDPGGAAGWTIADRSYYLSAGSNARTWTAFDDTASFKIVVREAAVPAARANNPATGLPSIRGTVQVGEGLTADVSGIADADGLPATFTYLWWTTDDDGVRARVGAIAPAYTLRANDKGKTVTVQVNFTDGAGTVESLTSEPTAAVVGAEPTELPHDLTAAVSGDAIVLTWKDAVNVPNYDFYQILRHRPELGEPEPLVYMERVHSTAATFTDTEVEPGVLYVYRVKAVVDWFGEYGEASLPAEIRMPDSQDDPELDPPTPPETNTPATGLPAISGTAQVGERLTADTSGIADADGLDNVAFSYQWLAADVEIAGATSGSYTLSDADEGKTIKVQVTFTDDGGNQETLTSEATEAVAARPNTADVSTESDENSQQAVLHILDAPVGQNEAVLYRSTTTMTPVHHIGNTHDSREEREASFKRTGHHSIGLTALNRRLIGTLTTAASATDLTIPLPSVDGLRVGEILEFGDGSSELMRIAGIDPVNSTVTVVERHKAHGASFVGPREWPAQTSVYHHRRARPGRLPAYMVESGERPSFKNFRMIWSGLDVPYLAMNVHFPGGDTELINWEELLVYLQFRRADGTGETIEGILPLGADAEVAIDHRQPGNPYSVREQHLRRYFGWPEELDVDPHGSSDVTLVEDTQRASRFVSSPEVTFLQQVLDWIYADDGHDLGRIYPSDDRYLEDELEALQGDPDTASEGLVRSYQVIVDVAILDGTDPRIDPEMLSVRTWKHADVVDLGDVSDTAASARVPGTLNRNGDEHDYYRITLSAQREIRLDLTGLNGKARMALEDSSRADMLTSDEPGLLDELITTVLDAGVYYVRVSAQESGPIGYQISYNNSPPTGVPTISGTAQAGETLTAEVTGIADADGLNNVTFTYRWIANDGNADTDIEDATGSTYHLSDSDVGKTIKVRVSFTDDGGIQETLTSEPTAAVAERPNTLATGLPAIGGTAQVGETLTADVSGISDADGLTNVSYSYQWTRNDGNTDTDIQDATGSTYTLVADDESQTIRVRVSFTDDRGYEETLTSEATAVVAAAGPNNPATGLPAIRGTVQVGERLTADVSGIADADGLPATFTYVWWTTDDDGVRARVKASTYATYTLRAEDKGKTVTVQVNFTDQGGTVESLTSEPTAAVVGSEPTELPHDLTAAVSGDAIVLTWKDAVNVPNYDFYQILRHRPELGEPEPLVYADRVHSTVPTFTDTEVDPGVLYVYRVKAVVDWFGNLGEASLPAEIRMPDSEETNSEATGQPTITGTAQVGETLTVDVSAIDDGNGLENATFVYQWLADDSEIAGATDSIYAVDAGDEGKAVKVKVSFTDDAGNEESLTSAETVPVAGPPAEPLTASLVNRPQSHNGTDGFTFEIRFSEEFDLSFRTLRDHAFTVTGGTVTRAQRPDKPSNMRWLITVVPDSNAAVTIVLPATEDCDDDGAICTTEGKMLSTRLELTVSGPGQ